MGETQIFLPGSRLPSIFYGRLKINWTNQLSGLSVTGVFGSSRKSMVGNRVRSDPTYFYPNPTMNLAQILSKMESHRSVCPIVEGLIAEAARRPVVLDGEHWLGAGPVPVPALAQTQPVTSAPLPPCNPRPPPLTVKDNERLLMPPPEFHTTIKKARRSLKMNKAKYP